MSQSSKKYDVAVIGGGPAGLMAAGRAAELGARVILIEKNSTPGKKLLLTGGGRCNLAHDEDDTRQLAARFGEAKKYLLSPFSKFGLAETLEFFQSLGVSTKIEEYGRIFPQSDRAQSVLDALLSYLKRGGVEIRHNTEVKGFRFSNKNIKGVWLHDGAIIEAQCYILATGGLAYPETGSDGAGLNWLREIGHHVIEPAAALVPIKTKETWTHSLSGLGLDQVELSIIEEGRKIASEEGQLLFTHFGISGPLAINLSHSVGQELKKGLVRLNLDLMPADGEDGLENTLQVLLKNNQNKQINNILSAILPQAISTPIIKQAGIKPDKAGNGISRAERLTLAHCIKNISFTANGLLGFDRAIATSGGLDPSEIDFRNMRSRQYDNLYIVGDVLDIKRPSGGYSLQLCWTSGWLAGNSAGEDCNLSEI